MEKRESIEISGQLARDQVQKWRKAIEVCGPGTARRSVEKYRAGENFVDDRRGVRGR